MDKKRVVAIAFTYTGAVVGAGFSSGREIWQFFGSHKGFGLFGIFVAALFFSGLAPLLFQLGKRLGINSYHQFFYRYLSFPTALFFDLIYTFFLLGSVAVMLAGSGAIFKDVFAVDFFTGIIITLIVVLAILYLKIEGILAANTYLMPLLIGITVMTVFKYLPALKINFFQGILNSSLAPLNQSSGIDWIFDAVLYGCYNLAIAVAVMIGLVAQEEEENIFWGSFWGGLFLMVLNLIIFTGLITAFHDSPQEEIPMLYLAHIGGRAVYLAYVIALYLAMISTAVTNLFAFNKRITLLFKIDYEYGLLFSALLIIPLARSGFTNLVENLYPIYGYFGFWILGFYILLWIREVLGHKKNQL